MIYSSPSFQMGAAQIGGQLGAADSNAVSSKEKALAKRELDRMRGALKGWLRYRNLLAAPPAVVSPTEFSPLELRMGKRLFVLLSEMFDSSQLPSENDPIALAQIAVSGKLPGEVATPTPTGLIWLWPVAIVVGLVLVTIVTKIRADAETAQEAAHLKCVETGRCTDYGFWLKFGGIALAAWIVWDKFGLRHLGKKAA
jgi:hypothetical protein